MTELRVLTWNVRGSEKPDLADLAATVAGYEPDIVALQEVRPAQAHRLAHRLGYHVRWTRKHFPYGVLLWWRAEGLAVLSPHPIGERHTYLLSPGVHSWTYRRRVALRVKVGLADGDLWVFNAHLASGADGGPRADQAAILAGAIAGERQRAEEASGPFRAVVVGDLNSDTEPEVLAPLSAARFADAWPIAQTRVGEPGVTSTTTSPARRIDYVLIEDGDACTSIEVPASDADWRRRSDHLPVIARLQIRSK